MLKQAFGKASLCLCVSVGFLGREKARRVILWLSSSGFSCLRHIRRRRWLSPWLCGVWDRQGGADRAVPQLTVAAVPPFFPKLAAHLERFNNGVKILPPSFSWALSDTQRSVSHHLQFRSFYNFITSYYLLISCFIRTSKVIISARGIFAVITCVLLPSQIPSTHKPLNSSGWHFELKLVGSQGTISYSLLAQLPSC